MGGADVGKAGLAAGDDGSGPIAGADGSRLTMTAGGAIAESAPGAGAAPSRLAPANWEAMSASLRAASSSGAGIDAGTARSPPGLGRPARAGRGMLAVSVGASSTRAPEAGSAPISGFGGVRPSGVHAIRQAAPPMARSGPNRNIVMGPVLLREDEPILVTKM